MDQSNFPKPTPTIFTPHLSLIYENNSWAQLDAYRVLAFALERGNNISPADKEKGHRLLRDFIGPFFGLSYSWIHSPGIKALSSTKVIGSHLPSSDLAKDEDVNMEDDAYENGSSAADEEMGSTVEDMNGKEGLTEFILLDQQPVANGTRVATVFGEGTITKYRIEDNVFAVQLAFGLAYLQPNTIICSLQQVPKSLLTDELRAEDSEELPRGELLVMGNQSLYLFFRLHEVLVRRLNTAKRIAFEVSRRGNTYSNVEAISGPSNDPDGVGRRRYESYLSLLYALLEGSTSATEGERYEDRVRSLLGHYAFELATMDKLVAHMLKNLQNMGNDEILNGLLQLYKRHLEAGSFKPSAFRQEAALLSEGEIIFAFQYCREPDSDRSILYNEYLGCISEGDGDEDDSISGAERKERSLDDLTNETDGEGNSSQPSSKRQKR